MKKIQEKKIKLIIIDFYGVIIKGNYKNVCKWLARKYKKSWEDIYEVLYYKYFKQAAEGKINERQFFLRTLKELGFKEDWQEVRSKHISYLILDRKALNYAKSLQKKGYRVLLLSKNTPTQMKLILDKYDIRKHIKHIINTYDLSLPKEDIRTIRYVLKKFKVKPEEAVMTDDQDFNLVEAEKIGVNTILYKNLNQFKKKIEPILNKK